MPFNLPSGTKGNISFGPGVLKLGLVGNTPTQDIGYVRSGAELLFTRDKLPVFQGSPRTLIDQFAVQDNVTFRIKGIEWNLFNLTEVFGGGVLTTSAALETARLGGKLRFDQVALQFTHVTPSSTTVIVRIWSALGNGEMTISFGDEIHEMPYTFLGLVSTTDWTNTALPTDGSIVEIKYQKS